MTTMPPARPPIKLGLHGGFGDNITGILFARALTLYGYSVTRSVYTEGFPSDVQLIVTDPTEDDLPAVLNAIHQHYPEAAVVVVTTNCEVLRASLKVPGVPALGFPGPMTEVTDIIECALHPERFDTSPTTTPNGKHWS